jgi:hypothetical protein
VHKKIQLEVNSNVTKEKEKAEKEKAEKEQRDTKKRQRDTKKGQRNTKKRQRDAKKGQGMNTASNDENSMIKTILQGPGTSQQ